MDTPTFHKESKAKQAMIVDQSSDSYEMLAVFSDLSQQKWKALF